MSENSNGDQANNYSAAGSLAGSRPPPATSPRPPSSPLPSAGPIPMPRANNQRRPFLNIPMNRNPINFGNYEGLFMHYLFVNLTMRYARYFKPKIRRLIEFLALLNATFMLILLVYIHLTFVRSDNYCLEHVEDVWPRTGILRVQVIRNATNLPHQKLYFAQKPFLPSSLSVESGTGDKQIHVISKQTLSLSMSDLLSIWGRPRDKVAVASDNFTYYDRRQLAYWSMYMYEDTSLVMPPAIADEIKKRQNEMLRDVAIEMYSKTPTYEFEEMNQEFRRYEINVGQMNLEASDVRDFYAIEFSTEFGYLRLSSEARARLRIPTLVVNLRAETDRCFGSDFKKLLLNTFLGYDDFIMTSIKTLAEKSNNQGYLRNLVTGEYFRFEAVWNNQVSLIIAFVTMLIFTIVVTMLLRYSYHQIFIAMVEIVRMVDANTQRLIFPIGPGPMFTIILALVGMEEIMLEFFHDSSIAFYVIIIIWVADQFDLVCMNSLVSRRHWIRYFFLYHFAFYAYHHRYNGRFSKLALLTSWLFIQHSMIYFLHHYELPIIQRQLELFERPPAPRPAEGGGGGGSGDGEATPATATATVTNNTDDSSTTSATRDNSRDDEETSPAPDTPDNINPSASDLISFKLYQWLRRGVETFRGNTLLFANLLYLIMIVTLVSLHYIIVNFITATASAPAAGFGKIYNPNTFGLVYK